MLSFAHRSLLTLVVAAAVATPAVAHNHGDKAPGTIVDVAAANADFETLVAAVKAAGLVETLSGPGPFTVFAPTDEAFAKLPAGTLEDLLKPENKAKLAAILTYHVVAGKVLAADAVKLDKATTVNGADADINERLRHCETRGQRNGKADHHATLMTVQLALAT
jgi:uncharacterized surface protein with fasciclin (FAS1) repeats